LCCGNEIHRDNKRGYEFICEAAKRGFLEAQWHLATLHQSGIDFSLSPFTLEPFLLPQDDVTAYMWYSVAAKNGHNQAEKERSSLHKKLSFSQLSQAIAIRKIWRRVECQKFGTDAVLPEEVLKHSS
jgi:TPR repeat protein